MYVQWRVYGYKVNRNIFFSQLARRPFISKLILLHCKMETIVAERIAFWPMIYVSDMYTRKVISVDLSEIFMPLYTRGVNLFEAFDKNVMSSIRLFLP